MPIQVTGPKLTAAESLYRRVPGWAFVEATLDHMRQTNPENTVQSIVDAKVVVLNVVYKTRILATGKVADHIVSIMSSIRPQGPPLVQALSRVRLKWISRFSKAPRKRSLASLVIRQLWIQWFGNFGRAILAAVSRRRPHSEVQAGKGQELGRSSALGKLD